MLFETVRLAITSVRRNVLRSFLTLLGIVIGVAAVIAAIAIRRRHGGEGEERHRQARLEPAGRARRPAARMPGSEPSAVVRQLLGDDVATLRKHLTGARAISAASRSRCASCSAPKAW